MMVVGYMGMMTLYFPWRMGAVLLCAIANVSLVGSWFHDSVHRNSVHMTPALLALQRMVAGPLGFSPLWWKYKHVRLHHRFPGNPEFDPDIQFEHVGRVSPAQRWRPMHRTQHLHMWLLLPFSTLNMFKPGELWMVGRFARRTGIVSAHTRWAYMIDKYVPALVFWVPVLVVLPLRSAMVTFLFFHLVAGTAVSLITQVQHNTLASIGDENIARLWPLSDQLLRTTDVGRGTGPWWWICGGVNFHVVHHIAPTLSFLELPEATSRLRARLHGIGFELPTHRGMYAAIRSHAALVRSLARP
jgi:linoleoyl-CoA desaturase